MAENFENRTAIELFRKTRPYCLHGLDYEIIEFNGDPFEGETIKCRLLPPKGETSGTVLGYSLRRYNKEFRGNDFFVTPLWVEWTSSRERSLLLDSKLHGYDAEIAMAEGDTGSAEYRGEGEFDIFACPVCQEVKFELQIEFHYNSGAYDLWQDEPDIEFQNYFDRGLVSGNCINCGKECSIGGIDA